MAALALTMVALLALNSLVYVWNVGKPRDTISPGAAAAQIVCDTMFILGILVLWRAAS